MRRGQEVPEETPAQAIDERLGEQKVSKYTKIDATEHKLEEVGIMEMITHMPASKRQKRMKATMEAVAAEEALVIARSKVKSEGGQ